MKHKARTLDGKWVEGWYYNPTSDKKYNFAKHLILRFFDPDSSGWSFETHTRFIEIDPSTLCQQVRGTDLFEGDEVELSSRDEYPTLGYIVWNDYHKSFMVKVYSIHERLDNYWKPTGRNRHD